MDYGRIIQDAFALTWRHRFLWIFALLGGGGPMFGGGGGNFSSPLTGEEDFESMPPELAPLLEAMHDVAGFLEAHIGLIVAVAIAAVLVGFVFFVLAIICRGALIASTSRLAQGEATSLSQGWNAGLRLAWKYVRLWLIGIAIAMLVGLAVASIAALLFMLGYLSEATRVIAIIIGVMLGLAGIGIAIALGIALTICFGFAERAIAVDGLGVRASLRHSVGLMRRQIGASLILWLIWLVLAIAIGIGLTIVGFVIALPLAGIVIVTFVAAGITAFTVFLAIAAVFLWGLVIWVLSAPASAFISAYWTLGYLAITDRYPPAGPSRLTATP